MEFSTTTILFFVLTFVSEIIGTINGFGSSVFLVYPCPVSVGLSRCMDWKKVTKENPRRNI